MPTPAAQDDEGAALPYLPEDTSAEAPDAPPVAPDAPTADAPSDAPADPPPASVEEGPKNATDTGTVEVERVESADAPAPSPAPVVDPAPETSPYDDAGAATEPPSGTSGDSPAVGTPKAAEPLAKAPGSEPPPVWEDADEMIEIAAYGSIETCEAISFPLTFLPGVGSVLASIFDWGCLIPGAFAVDYTQAFHGNRASLVWEAGAGLVAAKLWREFMKYAGIGAVIGLGLGGFAAGSALALTAPYYIPVAIAGLVTAGGVGFLVWKRVRSKGADILFSFTYWLLTSEFEDEAQRTAVRERSLYQYPVGSVNRAWALMATSAGAEPEREWWFYVPVVGAWGKAMARGEAVKSAMRRTGDDVLDEERVRDPEVLADMDATVDFFAVTEGALMAGAHALLLGGGLLFTVGTGFAALEFQNQGDFTNYALLAGTTGAIGIAVASGGVALLGLREVAKAFRPFAAPFVYGFTTPEESLTEDGEE